MIIPLHIGQMPLSRLAKLLGNTWEWEGGDTAPKRLVTDSREIERGDIFCALQGKRDGHLFARQAEERGARCIIAERKTEACIPHILVKHTPFALLQWARASLEGHSCLKIAITGSIGKTTTKEKCASLLENAFRTHKSQGNFNNCLGVSFSVLSMPKDTEALVLEFGMNQEGEIARLSQAVCPDIAIITNIGFAHIGNLGSREAIAKAKREILLGMKKDAPLFIPANEPLLFPCRSRSASHTVLPFEDEELEGLGVVPPKDIGEKWGLSFAYALGAFLGIEDALLRKWLTEAAKTPVRRKTVYIQGVTLIDDSYNASPESVVAALDFLALQEGARKIAVLGSMLELGRDAPLYHRAIARHAALCADVLFFFGEEKDAVASGAIGGGMKRDAVFLFDSAEEAKRALLPFVRVGDAVLCKASHGMGASSLSEALVKKFSHE
ncbi:MAG: hypothetical protein J6K61_06685 [Clostridia bacterium]|nr:hypothetical protein [Clostridia bacterium]